MISDGANNGTVLSVALPGGGAFDTLMPGAGALYMGYGNRVISEADAAGAVKREYIWLGDLIVGVVDGTALYWVENDHLGRPIRMRDAARADVWRAKYRPFGQALVTGPATLDARFPGQWFQLETGLARNWHRTYDQSLGRYLQPDPLGLSDGPSVYGYVHGSPLMGGIAREHLTVEWLMARYACCSRRSARE